MTLDDLIAANGRLEDEKTEIRERANRFEKQNQRLIEVVRKMMNLIDYDDECPCCLTSNHGPAPEHKEWRDKAYNVLKEINEENT